MIQVLFGSVEALLQEVSNCTDKRECNLPEATEQLAGDASEHDMAWLVMLPVWVNRDGTWEPDAAN